MTREQRNKYGEEAAKRASDGARDFLCGLGLGIILTAGTLWMLAEPLR
jgi:hypothetical protein